MLIYYERSSILTMEFPCQVAMAAAGHNEREGGGGCVLVGRGERQRDDDDDGDDQRPPKQPRCLETVDVPDDNETDDDEPVDDEGLRWRCLHDQRLSHDR